MIDSIILDLNHFFYASGVFIHFSLTPIVPLQSHTCNITKKFDEINVV